MLLFFSVARSAHTSQAERAKEAGANIALAPAVAGLEMATEAGEKMPTDKLLDISPLALRMSSPFNSSYWLTAA